MSPCQRGEALVIADDAETDLDLCQCERFIRGCAELALLEGGR